MIADHHQLIFVSTVPFLNEECVAAIYSTKRPHIDQDDFSRRSSGAALVRVQPDRIGQFRRGSEIRDAVRGITSVQSTWASDPPNHTQPAAKWQQRHPNR
jgi:hypothetical protein